jgi:chromosomal replication initiation ATPase DnaA
MAVDGATWWITAPNGQSLDWLQNRLSVKVGRILSSLVGQSVNVQFCLPEAKS